MLPAIYSNIAVVPPKVYRNSNPRGVKVVESYQKTLSPADYACFERARSAHHNGNEALPLFAAAMIAGNGTW